MCACCHVEIFGGLAGGRLVIEGLLQHEAAALKGLEYNALLHNGDLSYACGESWIHEAFGTMVEPLASRMPYMVTLGNHEYDHGSSAIPGWNATMAWCAAMRALIIIL